MKRMKRMTRISIVVAGGMLLLSGATASSQTRGRVTVDNTPIDPDATSVDPSVYRGSERRSVYDGIYTEAQAARGQATYLQACAQCHLDDLAGDGVTPSIVGPSFHFRWDEDTLLAMFEAIRDTMPQEAPASLSGQAYADISAYILQVNEYPPGPAELTADVEALERIFIDEVAP